MKRKPPPAWWPPKVDDKLRMLDHVQSGPIARLVHVVSVFEHQGFIHAVGAWFGTHKQWWHYDVIGALDAEFNKYWPDGEPCPRAEIQAMIDRAAAKL